MTIKGKELHKYITDTELQNIVATIANKINNDYIDKTNVVFIVILNGAFMFASDLFKKIDGLCKISFVKFSSYNSTSSTGRVKELIGLNEDIKCKDVIIVEDIVDTGKTMGELLKQLKTKGPKSIEVCTLMFKPNSFTGDYKIKYIGKEISNEFIIGYGFDLDGLGRNLPDIYQIKD